MTAAATRAQPPAVFDVGPCLDGVGAVLAGTANVIMQLGLAPVGYGVLESKVDSGRVDKHPIKRFRTTFTYLAVALLGTDEERRAYRAAVNGAHRQVRSDGSSPVAYNAFDPDLQLWVAACLYYGTVDVCERLHGPLPEEQADALYAHAARFGTTLQVPQHRWPPDRAAFAQYWQQGLARIRIDEPVRRYLTALMTREGMAAPLRGSRRFNTWTTTGFLPPQLRREMRLEWTDTDEERFARLLRRIGAVQRRLPRVVRQMPFNLLLVDLRLRRRLGRPLV